MGGESVSDDDLLTANEVAELVGWKQGSTAVQAHRRGSFPKWVQQWGRTKLWRRGDVEEWMATATRRPRKQRDD